MKLPIACAALVAALFAPTASASPISTAGAELRHMQLVMGVAPTPMPATWIQLNVHPRTVYREHQAVIGQLLYTRRLYRHPPHERQWLCIHGYEGDWEDGGGPYWGGLQMDLGFMRTFGSVLIRAHGEPHGFVGPNGWTNPWTPLEQMWAAERAFRESGYHRWPNTARYCGLL